jgi:hypothetical protein
MLLNTSGYLQPVVIFTVKFHKKLDLLKEQLPIGALLPNEQ